MYTNIKQLIGWLRRRFGWYGIDFILDEEKKLLKKQMEGAEAQVNHIEAECAKINISAGDLEPEIEAFMFQILERIDKRVSEDKNRYCLGSRIRRRFNAHNRFR